MVTPFKLDYIIHHWHESSRCPLWIKCEDVCKQTDVGLNATTLKLEFFNDARRDTCKVFKLPFFYTSFTKTRCLIKSFKIRFTHPEGDKKYELTD